MINKTIKTYKGFNQDMTCRGFQYEVGQKYEHSGDVEACSSGFHACGYPLDTFGYYAPATSVYCETHQSGTLMEHDGDSKVASSIIEVGQPMTVLDIANASVQYILDRITDEKHESNTGNRSAATNTGYYSAATNTGDQSAATNTGNRSAATNTGDQSAATNTGYWSAATNTGDQSAATNTGYYSAATNTGNWSAATNTGNWSAATNTGDQSAATNTGNRSAATNTGDRSAATNTGNWSAATNTGYYSAASVEGEYSVAVVTGRESKAKASEGSAIVLVERGDDGEILGGVFVVAGLNDVKPDTWYTLVDGDLVECYHND